MLERTAGALALLLLLLALDAHAQPAVQKEEPGPFVTYHLAHPPTRQEAPYNGYGGAVGYRFSGRFDLGLYARRSPSWQSPPPDDPFYRTGRTTIGVRAAKTIGPHDSSRVVRLAFASSVTVRDESRKYETLDEFEYRGGPDVHSYGLNMEGAFLWPLRLAEKVHASPGIGAFASVREYARQVQVFHGERDVDPGRTSGTAGLLLTLPVSVNIGGGDDWLSAEASLRLGPSDVIWEPARDVCSVVVTYAF